MYTSLKKKKMEISTLVSIGGRSSFTVQQWCFPINEDGYHQMNMAYIKFVID